MAVISGPVQVVVPQFGLRAQPRPAALHLAGDNQKVCRVARKPVDGGSDNHGAWGKEGDRLLDLRAIGGRVGDLVAKDLLSLHRPELAICGESTCAAVETTRA